MNHGRSIYAGASASPIEDDIDATRKLAHIHADIQFLYLSGVPLFTKEAIRNVSCQLNELGGKSGKVYVKALNGILVEFNVETGRVFPSGLDAEFVV